MATAVAGRCFLDLPLEIRLDIYRDLFGFGIALVDIQRIETTDSSFKRFFVTEIEERSSQFLRTCKTIWTEAAAVFYENTTFKLNRQVDFVFYMQPDSSSASKLAKLRHVEVDFKPEKLKDLPQGFSEAKKLVRAAGLEMLTDLKLTCHAVEWRKTHLVQTEHLKIRIPFETAHEVLELIGYAFLKNTRMNCMEDEGKIMVHVVFQLSTIALPSQFDGVSHSSLDIDNTD